MSYIKGKYEVDYYSWTSWKEYLSLEHELIQLMGVIPPDNQNLNIWSPKLANILIIICARLDSFLKATLRSYIWDEIKGDLEDFPSSEFNRIRRKNVKNWNITDYKKFYNPLFLLEKQRVYFKTRNFQKRDPFSVWQSSDDPPAWWRTYNQLKHDFYSNMKDATLRIVLDAIAGFFLVFSISPESFSTLVHSTKVVKSKRDLTGKIPNNNQSIKTHKSKTEELNRNPKIDLSPFKEYFSLWKNALPPYNFVKSKGFLLSESNLFLYLYNSKDMKWVQERIEKGYIDTLLLDLEGRSI